MKFTLPTGALLLVTLAGCQTHEPQINRTSHWNIQSLENRVSRNVLGYDPATNIRTYGEFRRRENQKIYMTVRRHLFNQNPENPFQDWGDEYATERYPHGILPNPYDFLYLGAVAGSVAVTAAGSVASIPVDYAIGSADTTLHEFDKHVGTDVQGDVEYVVTGSFRSVDDSEQIPVPPPKFRVRTTTVLQP